jgi:hypothetical protein
MFTDSSTGSSLGMGCSDPPWGGYTSAGPSPYPSYSPLQPSFPYSCGSDLTGPVAVPSSTLDPTSMGHLPTGKSAYTVYLLSPVAVSPNQGSIVRSSARNHGK